MAGAWLTFRVAASAAALQALDALPPPDPAVRPTSVWVVRPALPPPGLPTLVRGGCAQEAAVLVLARSEGQTVVLDDRIVVTVLDSRDGLVRLGIEAPRDVGVRRGELAPIEASPTARPTGFPTASPAVPRTGPPGPDLAG